MPILISGCASPVSNSSVVVGSLPGMTQHQKTVTVQTQGGGDTGAMDVPNISNAEFTKAIEESIIENGLFNQIVEGDKADLLLNVNILNMSVPLFGGSLTVTMEAGWSLMAPESKEVIMRKSITSSNTATMDQAFVGVTRLRLAVEGAVRENIRSGLMAISELEF